jgi:hypothetical protein
MHEWSDIPRQTSETRLPGPSVKSHAFEGNGYEVMSQRKVPGNSGRRQDCFDPCLADHQTVNWLDDLKEKDLPSYLISGDSLLTTERTSQLGHVVGLSTLGAQLWADLQENQHWLLSSFFVVSPQVWQSDAFPVPRTAICSSVISDALFLRQP